MKTINNVPAFILVILFSIAMLSLNLTSQETSDVPLTEGEIVDGVYKGYTFADSITDYSGEEIRGYPKEKSLNGVYGQGDGLGSLDVFILGEGEYAVFEWEGKRIVNGEGDDLKVFENGFFISGSDERMSLDLGTVQVSKDGEEWFSFPVSYDDNSYQNSNKGKVGFVGLNPVYLNMETNFIHPSAEEAGGDAFDLSDAGIDSGDYIRYVKVIDGGQTYPDGQIVSNGVDIDGVCAFYWSEE